MKGRERRAPDAEIETMMPNVRKRGEQAKRNKCYTCSLINAAYYLHLYDGLVREEKRTSRPVF